jgi:hypothetical protein
MSKRRYLTKSRYKLARECPTKLFYTGKKDQYEDQALDDTFLQALAYGGFQIGELAKVYHPGGHMISSLDYEVAVKATDDLMTQTNVVIYEAAFRFQDLFVRVDVLVKRGNIIQLIEVKSKSFDPDEEDPFYDKTALKRGKKKLRGNWLPYLEDVTFQCYVARKAYPQLSVSPYLMLVDKSKITSVDGLNQRFLLSKDDSGRSTVKVKEGTDLNSVGTQILCKIDVSDIAGDLIDGKLEANALGFEQQVVSFAKAYVEDKKVAPTLGSQCKTCQFKSDNLSKSGFQECWSVGARLTASELSGPFVFDVWNFRKADELIASGTYLMKDIPPEVVNVKENDAAGLSATERQWLQIESSVKRKSTPYVDYEGLRSEVDSWRFPLHFIDFETTMVAIPFNAGRRPYEQIAFQFSHHEIKEDGSVAHKGQYLNLNIGEFPNFDFIRALKRELDHDKGTVFRYAAHENTVMCQIYDQLTQSQEPDRNELCDWIKEMTISKDDGRGKWVGKRSMVDMCELVKRFYFHPQTNGSNSIKSVLPAVLQESKRIKELYGSATYGSSTGLKSLNFENWQWVKVDPLGKVQSPYKLLKPIFDGVDTEKLDLLLGSDELADGGSAMIAYAKMQFSEMSDVERNAVASALLRYCELDTLAMVMLYQHWVEVIQEEKKGRAA